MNGLSEDLYTDKWNEPTVFLDSIIVWRLQSGSFLQWRSHALNEHPPGFSTLHTTEENGYYESVTTSLPQSWEFVHKDT